MVRRMALLVLALAVTAAGGGLGALAQEIPATTGISIQPLRNEHVVDKGGEVFGKIRVINHSAAPLDVLLELTDFVPEQGNDGKVQLANAGPRSVREWTDFFPVNLSVAPRGSEDVFYRLRVPHDALPGGYYGAIVARTNAPSATVQTGVASLLLITVRGPAGSLKYAAEAQPIADAPAVVEGLPIEFGAVVKNTGNVHFKASFRVLAVDWRGQQAVLLETEEPLNVLPEAGRQLSVKWEGESGFIPMMGRFTVSPQVRWGPDSQSIDLAPVTVWVIPHSWLLKVLGGLALLIGLIVLGMRSYAASLRRQMRDDSGRRRRR